jgi:hypothetical protein
LTAGRSRAVDDPQMRNRDLAGGDLHEWLHVGPGLGRRREDGRRRERSGNSESGGCEHAESHRACSSSRLR